MPYRTNADLPPALRRRPPRDAQDIDPEAFNHARRACAGDRRREEAVHRIAWSAVRRDYCEAGDVWVPKAQAERTRARHESEGGCRTAPPKLSRPSPRLR